MKDKIKNIAEKLEHQIRMHELDLNDRIKDIPQIILLLEQGFSELKEIVSFYKFKSEMDEIFFFKIIKPKFFSKLIYYRKVYNIEMMRPNGQDCVLKNYFINELNQLENFYNKNIDFYKYYRSGSTHLDKYFFLRGKQDIQMTMETFYFERDPNFSTICDFKVAKIVANEMLRILGLQGNIYRNRTNYHSKFQTEGCRRVVGVSFPSACELLCRRPPLFQRGGMGIYAVFPERHAALCGESEKR